MTMQVSSATSPRALARRTRRKPATAASAQHAPARVKKQSSVAPTQAAAGAAAASKPAPAPAVLKSPEYDAAPIADAIGGVASGVTGDIVGPYVTQGVGQALPPEKFPFLATPYGSVIPAKIAKTITDELGNAVGSIVTDLLKGGKGEPGLGYKPTPANKMIASTTKGIVTSWMKLALTDALKPAPEPKLVYPPDVPPIGVDAPPAPPAPSKVLHTDTTQIASTIKGRLISTGIGMAYDQIVGPFVQRLANVVTGRAGEEVKPPAPLTPGKVVNGLADAVLSSMLVPSLEYAPLPAPPDGPVPQPGPTPFSATLGTSILNNVIGAAWSTVYGRGIGPAIENTVNELAGVRSKEDKSKATLPAMEQFLRGATRGVAVGATTYVLGNALQHAMLQLGAQLGGVGGALVAMGGAALIGSIGGTVVDATVGPMLGKLGGQIYSWITGKPAYEQRVQDAAKPSAPTPANPGPTPGSPVNAPNGNPGTVPAPDAPKAPAAPAAGKPKKRRKTGDEVVDRTAPAIAVPPAKLARIAASRA